MRLGHELEQQSIRDALTNTYNRRFLWEWANSHFKQAKRDNYQIACCLFDLDHFKNINDTYGHDVGDQVLIDFVRLIESEKRRLDILVRYGGEEFLAMISHADQEKAISYAERIRSLVENHLFGDLDAKSVTCSIGVALWDPNDNSSAEALIEKADKAMYEAKSSGRNCVRFAK